MSDEKEKNESVADQKKKIRERYKGVDESMLEIIPAIPQEDFFTSVVHKRVAVYARVSTDDPRQTSSYELQRNHYTDFVNQHPNWELVDIYADEGISGTSLMHRDAFIRMIADCKAGKIDLIVTKSVCHSAFLYRRTYKYKKRNLIAQSKVATDPIRKAFLIRQAVKLYKGNVFPEAETEEWLRPVSMQYLERYLAAIYKLCELLYDQKDYSRIHEYVVQALKAAPEEEKLYYWMIISLRKRDMVELAKKALETAKNTLDEEYYDLLVEQLNGFRKP